MNTTRSLTEIIQDWNDAKRRLNKLIEESAEVEKIVKVSFTFEVPVENESELAEAG